MSETFNPEDHKVHLHLLMQWVQGLGFWVRISGLGFMI